MTAARPRRLVAILGALLLTGLSLLAAPTASAADDGYVRLAHFSPDTPEVDVYLTAFKGSAANTVLKGVSYGTVSPYQRVAPGVYTVAMRAPGSSASSTPLLRTNVTVRPGGAYTVAGVGPNSGVRLRVLTDDLSRPPAGKGRVRVVQASASAPVVDVVAQPGTVIARGATFPSTTDYADVKAQPWTVRVQPRKGSGGTVQRRVIVRAGSVYSLIVLDKAAGGVQVEALNDAAGSAAMPKGAVATGLGGAAGADDTGSVALLGASALVALGGATALARRRRLASVAR